MAKRRRKRGNSDSEAPKQPAPAADATTSLGSLLKAANVAVVKPPRTLAPPGPESLRPASLPPVRRTLGLDGDTASQGKTAKTSPAGELRMLNDAYAGVAPLKRKQARKIVVSAERRRLSDEDRAAEAAARKRLAALVSGGIHFKIKLEDGYVQGQRSEVPSKLVLRLGGKAFAPDATLDLHGERTARVTDVVEAFVRGHHRRGAKHLLVIVGKGLHSEDGQGVLLHALIDALTKGGAAPLVRCFASAHTNLGGTGAVAVLLV
jgi:DNA-nicking Smr family endonuclease